MNKVSRVNTVSKGYAAAMMAIAIFSTTQTPTSIQTAKANLSVNTNDLSLALDTTTQTSWSQSTIYIPPDDLGMPSRREPGGDR